MDEFRVIAGTYERLLYGLDACWKNESDPTDKSLDLKLVIAYATHIGCVKSVATGGNYLASGSTDEVIKLYDLKKRKELGSLHSHDGTINQLAFHRSTHLLSASDDGSIAIYRTKDWELLKSLRGHKGPVIDIAIHPSGKLAISIARDMT
jgi:protein MAK11